MRKHQLRTKKVNQTFSIPIEISAELHMYVKPGEMSLFVSDAIQKELQATKDQLRKEYAMGAEDEGQQEAMKDWEPTVGDGLDEW